VILEIAVCLTTETKARRDTQALLLVSTEEEKNLTAEKWRRRLYGRALLDRLYRAGTLGALLGGTPFSEGKVAPCQKSESTSGHVGESTRGIKLKPDGDGTVVARFTAGPPKVKDSC